MPHSPIITMFEFEKLLQEEGLAVKSLPKTIQDKIRLFRLTADKEEKKEVPSPKTAETMKRNDLTIAGLIQDVLDASGPAKETAEEKLARETKAATDKATKDAADKDALEKQNLLDARNRIVTIMNNDNQRCIGEVALTEILGRKPKDNETVGDLVIYKIYLTRKWKAQR